MSRPQVVLGIAGGSGSGKSRLARLVADAFPGRASMICHDWYYRDNAALSAAKRRQLNFDHPDALETGLMGRQLDQLMSGRPVEAPVYEYARQARLKKTHRVEPRPLLIIDGILVLHEKALRERMTHSVFIEVPDDIRLLRRVRRDSLERGIDLEEILRLYEDSVRPMHRRYVRPSSSHATWVWSQLEDAAFPDILIKDLSRRLDGR